MPYCQMGKISVMEEEKEEVCQRDSSMAVITLQILISIMFRL